MFTTMYWVLNLSSTSNIREKFATHFVTQYGDPCTWSQKFSMGDYPKPIALMFGFFLIRKQGDIGIFDYPTEKNRLWWFFSPIFIRL